MAIYTTSKSAYFDSTLSTLTNLLFVFIPKYTNYILIPIKNKLFLFVYFCQKFRSQNFTYTYFKQIFHLGVNESTKILRLVFVFAFAKNLCKYFFFLI